MKTRVHETVLALAVEYLLLTLPVLIYVAMEAVHHQTFWYLLVSPEWSIATIFILVQTYRLFIEEMSGSPKGRRMGDFLMLTLVLFAIAASINAFMAIGHAEPSISVLTIKWLLFAVATLIFIYVAGAAIYSSKEGHE